MSRQKKAVKKKHADSKNAAIDPALYINRELSWIEFNRRVLQEAQDETHPLLERLKFIAIFSSNLDEFFMVRVASMKEQIGAGVLEKSPDGLYPKEQIVAIRKKIRKILSEQSATLQNDILPKLEQKGIRIVTYNSLAETERTELKRFFNDQIFPVLTPLAVDLAHPFPYISNLTISLAILIRDPNGEERFARIKVPDIVPRLVKIDDICSSRDGAGNARFMWIEDLIAANLGALFPNMEIVESHLFRVTRDTDIEIQDDEASDLLSTIEEGIRQRRYGAVVRIEVNSSMPDRIRDILTQNLEIESEAVYFSDAPLGLNSLMTLYDLPRPELKDTPFHAFSPFASQDENEDIFSLIRKKDVLLHHPYDSFTPVVDFIRKAAEDPNVLAIKQTLYRAGSKSPIIQALIDAAENGKQVAALVELKARFDEENNITWARRLEEVGVHVVYGLVGLKTHCKIALVVRKEASGIRRYVHLGTGNYNASTARIYTDLGLLTCREDIGADASEVFNYLTGYSKQKEFRKLLISPINVRESILNFIDREIAVVKSGMEGRIIFKMNALVDPEIIKALYRASQAGVKMDLIIRGICCLRPGLKGISDNIRVTSIVGRFLEHSRIFYFRNGGNEQVYLGSADMMQRNLDRRVEILFPVEDVDIKNQIIGEILAVTIMDNVKARQLSSDGTYHRTKPDGEALNSQLYFLQRRTNPASKLTDLHPQPTPSQPKPQIVV
jgi:polyphosphate kinase